MTDVTHQEESPRDDDAIAAEYVLGVLSAAERKAFAARMATDPGLRHVVENWEMTLSPFIDNYIPVEPPASAKAALDRRLFAAGSAPRRSMPIWGSLFVWRALTGLAFLALAIVITLPELVRPDDQAGPQYVAALSADNSDVRYLAVYDRAHPQIGLSHLSGERAPHHDFELWIVQSGKAPISLGVIPKGASVHLVLPESVRMLLDQGGTFAISLEPEGGSPSGQPTGAVVAAGDIKKI